MTFIKSEEDILSSVLWSGRIEALTPFFWESIHSNRPVNGLTHNFYRYPARFSPEFTRAIIQTFSQEGDTILDPFMGGGTTIVEGIVNQRKVIGLDINPLAVFLARVKSTPLSRDNLLYLRNWIEKFPKQLSERLEVKSQDRLEGYYKNTPWWIRNQILKLLELISEVREKRVQNFLRCALLKTGQWALDCKEMLPTSKQFTHNFYDTITQMCEGMEKYRSAIKRVSLLSKIPSYRCLLLSSAAKAGETQRISKSWLPVKLVITSPPYPGVHVLYNRWQVKGRRETPLLFNIIRCANGHVPSYYTFGARSQRGEENYFKTLIEAYKSVAKLLDSNSLVVQLVAFPDPNRQITKFMQSMTQAGYQEILPSQILTSGLLQMWRQVPNRKWYANGKNFHSCRELLLFHRLKS